MKSNLKRDQIPLSQAANWRSNIKEEKELSFNLILPTILLHNETYKKLRGENENGCGSYLGLEAGLQDGKYPICAFAVSAFLLGSGNVYVDYESPVYKLGENNVDYSANTKEVVECIKRFSKWRMGEIDGNDEKACVRQFIYPKAFLLTKYELHEIFNVQKKEEAKIDFGIAKTMTAMILAGNNGDAWNENSEVFSIGGTVPGSYDEKSIYNV